MKTANDGTVFLPLPNEMRRPINGGCQCPFCVAHPDATPMWDTLASHPDKRFSWTVHFPEATQC